MGSPDRQPVEVEAEAEFACAVLDDQPAVLEGSVDSDTLLPQQFLVPLVAQVSARLEQVASGGRGQPDIAERWSVRLSPRNEVPCPKIEVLVVDVPTGRIAEGRPSAMVEQDFRPEFTYFLN
jgi:hypothetical protein